MIERSSAYGRKESLWKEDIISFLYPSNNNNQNCQITDGFAEQILESLMRKLSKDDALCTKNQEGIADLLQKGWNQSHRKRELNRQRI